MSESPIDRSATARRHELVSDGSGAARPGVILFPTVMGITDLERGFAERLVGNGLFGAARRPLRPPLHARRARPRRWRR